MTTEVEAILLEPQSVTLASGTEVRVLRLKTRQLMKLMRILTTGAGTALAEIQFDADTPTDVIVPQLIALVAFSIPEAEEETIDFVRSMVEPANLIHDPRSKPEHEVNADLLSALDAELNNPELDDLMSIIETVAKVEGPHLASLGKRLGALFAARPKTTPSKQKRAASTKSSSAALTRTAS
jgi:hypothetical protein